MPFSFNRSRTIFLKVTIALFASMAFSVGLAFLLINPWFAEEPQVLVIGAFLFIPTWAFTLCLCAWTKIPWSFSASLLGLGVLLLAVNYIWMNL